jgi:hypothetical protein
MTIETSPPRIERKKQRKKRKPQPRPSERVDITNWEAAPVQTVLATRAILGNCSEVRTYELLALGLLDAVKDGRRTLITTPSIKRRLSAMCRHLRRTTRFLPAISECLEVLERVEWRINKFSRLLSEMPKRIAAAKEAVVECEQRENNKLEARQKAIDELIESWRHGADPSPMPHQSIVEEAKCTMRMRAIPAST